MDGMFVGVEVLIFLGGQITAKARSARIRAFLVLRLANEPDTMTLVVKRKN